MTFQDLPSENYVEDMRWRSYGSANSIDGDFAECFGTKIITGVRMYTDGNPFKGPVQVRCSHIYDRDFNFSVSPAKKNPGGVSTDIEQVCSEGNVLTELQFSAGSGAYDAVNGKCNTVDTDVVMGSRFWQPGPSSFTDSQWIQGLCPEGAVMTGFRTYKDGGELKRDLDVQCQKVYPDVDLTILGITDMNCDSSGPTPECRFNVTYENHGFKNVTADVGLTAYYPDATPSDDCSLSSSKDEQVNMNNESQVEVEFSFPKDPINSNCGMLDQASPRGELKADIDHAKSGKETCTKNVPFSTPVYC